MYCNRVYGCVGDWIANKSTLRHLNCKILQINARGINELSKFDSIKEILERSKERFDAIVICETWLTADRIHLYKIEGFVGTFSCRNESHGGLAVFTRAELNAVVSANTTQDGFHHIHCEFKTLGIPVDLHAVYRPPSFDVRRFFLELEHMISRVKKGHRCILVGDINIPTNLTGNNVVGEYTRLLASYNMLITNTNTTRPASNNILDHVVCTDTLAEKVVNDTVSADLSDHCLVISSFDMTCHTSERTLSKQITDHNRLNDMFRQSMMSLPHTMTANETLEYVIECYKSHVAECTRTVTCQAKVKGNCPWMTLELWKLIRIKERQLKLSRANSRDVRASELLKHVSKILQKKKAECKREYYLRILNGNPQKKAWKLINEISGKRSSKKSTKEIRRNGQTITDPLQICSTFNEYFCNIGNDLASNIASNRDIHRFNTLPTAPSSIFLRPATINEIVLLINDLDVNKSGGPDKIPTKFVKVHYEFFAQLLHRVFNEIIQTGQYPSCLKLARVIPVFKSGDPRELSNYRPISTLSVIDKVLEKLLVSRIVEYISRFGFMYSHQYGFRKGSSTLAATCDLVEEIYDTLDKRQLVGGLFIDLKKAFDTVNHKLLIQKLECYGIRGIPKQLIESYLMGRSQYVVIDDCASPQLPITIGVPQGSNLGPILFLLYINDLCKLKLHGKLRLFADDTSLSYRGNVCADILEQIREDVDRLMEYFSENMLSLNLAKTKYMLIHSGRRRIPDHGPVIIQGHTLEKTSEYCFLGLIIDETMSWKSHIKSLKKSISSLCGLLRRVSPFMPFSCMQKMYYSLIHSRLQYLVANWGLASKSHIRELQVLQNRCLKIVYNKPFLYPTNLLYSTADKSVLPIDALHELQILVQIRKITTDPQQHHNTSLTTSRQYRPSRQLGNFILPRSRSGFSHKKFSFVGSKLFNELPMTCKTSRSLTEFKNSVKQHLKSKIR